MTRRRFSILLIASLVFVTAYSTGAAPQAGVTEYGPPKGTLVIVGGGNTDNTGIMEKFIELGGGVSALETRGAREAWDTTFACSAGALGVPFRVCREALEQSGLLASLLQ